MNSDFQKSQILKFNFGGRFKIHKIANPITNPFGNIQCKIHTKK
jgi:hypothetical protein